MSSDGDGVGDDVWTKGIITAVILVMMVPGLVVEPGPVSEIVGVGAIGTVWGVELTE
jgi:hypothetical protein